MSSLAGSSVLRYKIAGCSDHSNTYLPENVLVDDPYNQHSRWSAGQQAGHRQSLLLELENEAVLTSITFGKYHKVHPCNMKEFKIYTGIDATHMQPALTTSLKNDAFPETFALPHTRGARVFPTRYIRIVPISAHGQSYHISVWHVALAGIGDATYVADVRAKYDAHRETLALRHILKHLRQRQLLPPFNALLAALPSIPALEDTAQVLEHPELTALHSALVLSADYAGAEAILARIGRAPYALFGEHLRSSACPPRTIYRPVDPQEVEDQLRGSEDVQMETGEGGGRPARRGGHAMCADEQGRRLWVFGGYDGRRTMDDLWCFEYGEGEREGDEGREGEEVRGRWVCVSESAAREGGPGPRSNCEMCFDPSSGCLYILGRLVEKEEPDRSASTTPGGGTLARMMAARRMVRDDLEREMSEERRAEMESAGSEREGVEREREREGAEDSGPEFWRYWTRGERRGVWERLDGAEDEEQREARPPLVYDHQMVLDAGVEGAAIYVFGGRVAHGDLDKYAGLYKYEIRTGRWKVMQPPEPGSARAYIAPRHGHSMVLDSKRRVLFVLGGQRDDKCMADMYAYDLAGGGAARLFASTPTAPGGGPEACWAQRAVIDDELREIYLFPGLQKEEKPRQTRVVTALGASWVYRYEDPLRPGVWTRMLAEDAEPRAPVQRYAHRVAYDRQRKRVFVHGGNAGVVSVGREGEERREEETRLDDLWEMRLERMGPEEIVRKAIFRVRQHRFREMCGEGAPVRALQYLQTDVAAVVDHGDPDEAEAFRGLLAHLLGNADAETRNEREKTQRRMEVFESLLGFVNEDAKEPAADLIDLVDREEGELW